MLSTAEIFFAALEYCFQKSRYKTQKDFAQAAGLAQSTISQALKREKAGSAELQGKFARAFGYDLVDFLALGRWILQGKNPEEFQSPDDSEDRVGFSAENMTKEQLELLGAFMAQNPNKRVVVVEDSGEFYIGDTSKRKFEEGKRFVVRLNSQVVVRTASKLDGSPVLIKESGGVEKPPGPWPGDWVMGRVVLAALPE